VGVDIGWKHLPRTYFIARWRSTNSNKWHRPRHHVCLRLKESACCMERVVVRCYVTSFIMNWFLHDSKGLGLRCWCGDYGTNWEMVALTIISRPIGAHVEFSAIVKIHKYRRLHEGHHIISMAMEVHDTFGCDMDHFIREWAHIPW
jgi:hypothetical protein